MWENPNFHPKFDIKFFKNLITHDIKPILTEIRENDFWKGLVQKNVKVGELTFEWYTLEHEHFKISQLFDLEFDLQNVTPESLNFIHQ